MTTPDPFSRIPHPDSEYEGTILETAAERAAREPVPPRPEEETGR